MSNPILDAPLHVAYKRLMLALIVVLALISAVTGDRPGVLIAAAMFAVICAISVFADWLHPKLSITARIRLAGVCGLLVGLGLMFQSFK